MSSRTLGEKLANLAVVACAEGMDLCVLQVGVCVCGGVYACIMYVRIRCATQGLPWLFCLLCYRSCL